MSRLLLLSDLNCNLDVSTVFGRLRDIKFEGHICGGSLLLCGRIKDIYGVAIRLRCESIRNENLISWCKILHGSVFMLFVTDPFCNLKNHKTFHTSPVLHPVLCYSKTYITLITVALKYSAFGFKYFIK